MTQSARLYVPQRPIRKQNDELRRIDWDGPESLNRGQYRVRGVILLLHSGR